MTTGLRETSSNLFVCKCSGKAFAVGINPDTLQVFGLLCLTCGIDYAIDFPEDGDAIPQLPHEPIKVLH